MTEKTFTEALGDLQNAAGEIGKQTVSLEESMKLFEKGMKDAEYCNGILDDAEQKIEIYDKNGEDDAE